MAIDGVKIIDSDQGYDIYNEVVGRYRDGDHVANIIKDILDEEKDYCQTDFFTEIYLDCSCLLTVEDWSPDRRYQR